ncbi:hypothetical protein BC629DRAFT_1283436 [Irpex lacteus]|nr:hypothetical protein BC629DRAFT_1283436 [Irpex lacteus]
MNSLPIELHSQIFELACSDDGTTAQSLALVSRYVREVSKPFLLQSIAVSGLHSLTALADKLESLPMHKRRVRNLFISDWTRKEIESKVVSAHDADMDRYEAERLTIMRLLESIAPTLETLSFVISCPFNSTRLIGHLFSLSLPSLEALSVHGFYPFPPSHENMPNLRRLHLSGNRNPHGIFQVGSLRIASPKLEHLHISGLVSAASFADELNSVLLPDKDAPATSLLHATLPPSIKRITVTTGPSPAATRRLASAHAQHRKMEDRLNALVGSRGDAVDGVYLEVRKAEAVSCSYENLRREWAEGLTFERMF